VLRTDLIAPVPELLRRNAAVRAAKIAYRDAETSVSYADLFERTGRLAGHLADAGIAANDAVAIMLHLGRSPHAHGLYNVGSGVARTWNDLVTAIFTALEVKRDAAQTPTDEQAKFIDAVRNAIHQP